jgi:hypothetical protein
LREQHVRLLRESFPRVEVRGHQFVSMVRRLLPRGAVLDCLDRCDTMLLAKVPALQRYCRYVVLTLRR